MPSNKQALLASILILATGALALTGYFLFKTNPDTKGTTPIEQMPSVTYEDQRYRTFSSAELGLTFQYPASWKAIETNIFEPIDDMADQRTEVTLSIEGRPFIALLSAGDPVPRGGWWGDVAAEAESNAAVANFCDTYQTNSMYYIQPNEGCEILINQNGVTFARLKGSVEWYGSRIDETYTYISHHAEHPFAYFALSAQSLRENDLDEQLGNTEKAIQEIANSLRFIQKELE